MQMPFVARVCNKHVLSAVERVANPDYNIVTLEDVGVNRNNT
jgi:hypothetical protein